MHKMHAFHNRSDHKLQDDNKPNDDLESTGSSRESFQRHRQLLQPIVFLLTLQGQ